MFQGFIAYQNRVLKCHLIMEFKDITTRLQPSHEKHKF